MTVLKEGVTIFSDLYAVWDFSWGQCDSKVQLIQTKVCQLNFTSYLHFFVMILKLIQLQVNFLYLIHYHICVNSSRKVTTAITISTSIWSHALHLNQVMSENVYSDHVDSDTKRNWIRHIYIRTFIPAIQIYTTLLPTTLSLFDPGIVTVTVAVIAFNLTSTFLYTCRFNFARLILKILRIVYSITPEKVTNSGYTVFRFQASRHKHS